MDLIKYVSDFRHSQTFDLMEGFKSRNKWMDTTDLGPIFNKLSTETGIVLACLLDKLVHDLSPLTEEEWKKEFPEGTTADDVFKEATEIFLNRKIDYKETEKMTTIREFLTAYADRYPKKIRDRDKFINETNNLYIDYSDGIFTFSKEFYTSNSNRPGVTSRDIEITGSGGHNGDILEDEEYFFVWDNFIRTCPRFTKWYEGLKLTHKDFMEISVNFYNTIDEPLGKQEISAAFTFYEGITE